MILTVSGVEHAAGRPLALLDEPVDLFHAAVAVPPHRGHDARRERALVGELAVGAQQVGLDPRVLPPGDAERVQLLLRAQQVGLPLRDARLRGHGAQHVVGGAFLQRAGRRAVGVAHDVAVPRVGRRRRDARHLERPGVHPRRRARRCSTGRRAGRARPRRDLPCADRRSRRTPVPYQPPPTIHSRSGFASATCCDACEVVVLRVQVVEVHVQQVAGPDRRVHVRVLEARARPCAREGS